MEWFVAVLDDLECKIFFVGQPWWPTFEGRGGGMGGEDGEGITAGSIENPYFDPCLREYIIRAN